MIDLRELMRKIKAKVFLNKEEAKRQIREFQKILIANDVDVKLVFEIGKEMEKKVEEIEEHELNEGLAKLFFEKIKEILGKEKKIELKKQKIMLIGLFGSGKTTTAAKLANYLKNKGLSVAVASVDFERPAAIEQLEQLTRGIAKFVKANSIKRTIELLLERKEDVKILDTPGRNSLDEKMKEELEKIKDLFKPDEIFLILPADLGQFARKMVEGFLEVLPITGVIITKFDGSTKAGSALIACKLANVGVAFVGTGEKISDFEEFDREDFALRLLGIPNLQKFIEKLKEEKKEEELNFETFLQQIKEMRKLGSLSNLFSQLGIYGVEQKMLDVGEEKIKIYEAVINSMTPEERRNPDLLWKEKSRIERIAKGSGRKIEEVKELLKNFEKAKKLMKMMKKARGMRKRFGKLFGFF